MNLSNYAKPDNTANPPLLFCPGKCRLIKGKIIPNGGRLEINIGGKNVESINKQELPCEVTKMPVIPYKSHFNICLGRNEEKYYFVAPDGALA